MQDESEAIGAVTEAAVLGQLELESGLKARSDGLFFAKPGGARAASVGRCEAQHVAQDFGIADCSYAVGRCEIDQTNGGVRGGKRTNKKEG